MLEYFALFLVFFVIIVVFYGIIIIHDIPYEIAHKRNHPHQDAIHVAGWVSLFTLHTIWPFLWIWATLYKPEYPGGIKTAATLSLHKEIESLKAEVASLEQQLAEKENS